MQELELAQVAAASLTELKSAGLDVIATDDFEYIARVFGETGRAAQSPMMDITRLDFTKGRAFWMFVTRGGKIIGGMGAKLEDLGDEKFESYFRRVSQSQYGFEGDPIEEIAAPISETLGGDLIYFGELEFLKTHRGNLDVLRNVARIMKCLAVMRWPRFDWMYAFIPDEHFRLARVYDFNLLVPAAVTWRFEATGRLDSHWIMANNRVQFRHWMAMRTRELALPKQK